MAVQTVQNLPAQFVQDLGQDLARQVTAQSGVPVVSTGLAGTSSAFSILPIGTKPPSALKSIS